MSSKDLSRMAPSAASTVVGLPGRIGPASSRLPGSALHGKRRVAALTGIACALLLWCGMQPAGAQDYWHKWSQSGQAEDYVPNVVLVRFEGGRAPQRGNAKTGFAGFDATAAQFRVTDIRQAFPIMETVAAKRPLSQAMQWLRGVHEIRYEAPVSSAAVANVLAREPGVEIAEPKFIHRTADTGLPPEATPNDPKYAQQGYLKRLELDDAWDVTKGSAGSVVIAIVDEGIEWTHPDLQGNVWTNPDEVAGNNLDDDSNGYVDDMHGWNFESNTADPKPETGDKHGTRVAGIANAVTDNSVGIAGAAWNVKSMMINAGCSGRAGVICHTNEGIIYAYANGADIINASWTSPDQSDIRKQVVQSALDAGALIVAATGNDGYNIDTTPLYPASYNQVLSVGATRKDSDIIATFSNYGRSANIFAPGVLLETTETGSSYTQDSGTSFSAPLVAGIAALALTANSSFDPEQIRELVRLTAVSIDGDNSASLAGLLGRGRPDADEAVTTSEQPGVRLISFSVSDNTTGTYLVPSTSATITAKFTNFGGAATNLTVGITSSDANVTMQTSTATVGALAYGSSYTGTFTFTVGASTPRRHSVLFSTTVADGSFSDAPDVARVLLNTPPVFATHSTPSIKVSIVDDGNIGHKVFKSTAHGGDGFQVKQSNGSWKDLLFEGGLLLATSQSKIVDCVRNSAATQQNNDLVLKSGSWPAITDPGSVGSEDGRVSLVEASASTANLGLEVTLDSYTFNASANDDFVILKYTISNTTSSSVDDVYVGLFLDWDLGSSDDAKYDAQRKVGYLEATDNRTITAGARLLSTDGQLIYAAIDNAASLYDGFTDAEKWSLLSGGVGTTTRSNGDLSQLIGAGPIDVGASASNEVVIALVTGSGSSGLLTNADAAQSVWNSTGPAAIQLSADQTSVSEDAGATTVTVTATVTSGTLSSAETLPIAVAGSGTATAVDFAAVSGFNISLAAGATSGTGTFTLTPTDDTVDETDETITISSTSTSVTQSATLTLTDDDAAPTGIAFTVSPASVGEADGATSVTLTATVKGGTTYAAARSLPVTVTGSGTATAVDFAAVASFNLAVAAEAASGSATFTLTPTNDVVDETDETITVGSSNALVTQSATLTLTDDDAAPKGIEFTVSPTSVDEADGATSVTVSASVKGGTTYAAAQSLPVTVTGSATDSAVDFAAVASFNLAVAAESTSGSATFTLTPTNDAVDETDESITVGSSSALVTQSATLTLTDDDAAPTGMALSVSPASVDEGDGATSVTVTATVQGGTTYATAQSLPVAVSGSGAATAVDFADVSGFTVRCGGRNG